VPVWPPGRRPPRAVVLPSSRVNANRRPLGSGPRRPGPILLVLCLGALSLPACETRASSRSGAPHASAAPLELPLDQRVVSPDGLIAIHSPSDFEVTSAGGPTGSSIVLAAKTKGTHGTITFVTKPMMPDVETFVRAFYSPEADESAETRASATCSGQPGMEIRTTWTVNNHPFSRRRCYSVVNGHGLVTMYTVLQKLAPTAEPRLKAIVDATEFLK
jgi:hypothetical protein